MKRDGWEKRSKMRLVVSSAAGSGGWKLRLAVLLLPLEAGREKRRRPLADTRSRLAGTSAF